MKKTVVFIILLLVPVLQMAWGASITSSKHNLSTNGPGDYRAYPYGAQICVYCHTPHNAMLNVPLWNRQPGTVAASSYRLYSSSLSMRNISNRSISDGVSLLCLSCHDGSPLGGSMLLFKPPLTGESYDVLGSDGESGIAPTRNTRKGPDLSNHHPVNFNVTISGEENRLGDILNQNGFTVMKTAGASVGMPLFKTPRGENTLECASCHKVHDPANPSFLRASMAGNELCLACHIY